MQNDASGAFLPPNMRTFSAVDRSFCGESRERFDVEGVDATSATASSLKFDMSGGDFSSGGGESGPPAAEYGVEVGLIESVSLGCCESVSRVGTVPKMPRNNLNSNNMHSLSCPRPHRAQNSDIEHRVGWTLKQDEH